MKFNLLTKYILIYVSVAIIGFVGVTVISYKIDYNRVYSEQTENMYRQAVSIAFICHENLLSLTTSTKSTLKIEAHTA